jgi:carbohydrate diacid regulator
MLDSSLAQRLINKITKQFGYNINVMDDRGIIIASADSSRIGAFHQGAYTIIRDRIPIKAYKEVDENIIGVKPGIIMTTHYRNTIIGVVGVSGDPDVLMPFAKLVKLTFETMYEHEIKRENAAKAKLQWDSFINALLYEEPRFINRIRKLSAGAGFEEKHQRIPIIIKNSAHISTDNLIRDIKGLASYNNQDIVFALDSTRILVFKVITVISVSNVKKLISLYAEEVDSLFKKYYDLGAENMTAVTYFVGSIQTTYEHYNKAFEHAVWLENYLDNTAERINYFLDYLMEYVSSQMSREALNGIFGIYNKSLNKNISREMFAETVQAFFDSNMNLDATAEKLFVHRNTVVFRLRKIKKLFGIEPVKNVRDAIMLFYLLYYYKNCV